MYICPIGHLHVGRRVHSEYRRPLAICCNGEHASTTVTSSAELTGLRAPELYLSSFSTTLSGHPPTTEPTNRTRAAIVLLHPHCFARHGITLDMSSSESDKKAENSSWMSVSSEQTRPSMRRWYLNGQGGRPTNPNQAELMMTRGASAIRYNKPTTENDYPIEEFSSPGCCCLPMC